MTWQLDPESWNERDYTLWPLFDRTGVNSTRLYMLVLYGLVRSNGWRTVVELGGFRGNTTAILAQAAQLNSPEGTVHVYEEDTQCAVAIIERFRGQPVLVYNTRSQTAVSLPTPVDFVFVDGEHTYDGCCGDIRKWAPQIAPGGCMAFHDAALPDIQRAIADTLPARFTERIHFPGDLGLTLTRC